jgi:hypothetical protein
MNTKHKEYKEGKPQVGHRSRVYPGCKVNLDLRYYNKKSSRAKTRPQARPRFLEKHDHLWRKWMKGMRKRGLTEYEVTTAEAKNIDSISRKLTEKFINTCPLTYKKPDEHKCTSYYVFCMETESEMSKFYLSELKKLTIPKSRDMFVGQGCVSTLVASNEPINAGWIYLITSPHDNIVKIGKASINNLDSRFKEAQRHRVDAELCFAAYVDNYSKVENKLHRDYDKQRCDGPQRELFTLSPGQIDDIKTELKSISHDHQAN